MFPLKIYNLQKNDLNTAQIILYDMFGCSILVYNVRLQKSNISPSHTDSYWMVFILNKNVMNLVWLQ